MPHQFSVGKLRVQHLAEKGEILELQNQPLEVTRELIERGWAQIGRRWVDKHNGRDWPAQAVTITDAGRAEWLRRQQER